MKKLRNKRQSQNEAVHCRSSAAFQKHKNEGLSHFPFQTIKMRLSGRVPSQSNVYVYFRRHRRIALQVTRKCVLMLFCCLNLLLFFIEQVRESSITILRKTAATGRSGQDSTSHIVTGSLSEAVELARLFRSMDTKIGLGK